ncbi:MAG: ATP-binding protein [Proteobacteria bacterium]|nr:ATP-binding protein [Pseudomonadota bacterium]
MGNYPSIISIFRRQLPDSFEIQEVKQVILFRILIFCLLPGIFAVIPGVYQTWYQGRWGYSIVYAIAYFLFFTSFIFSLKRKYYPSGATLVIGLFCLSVAILSRLGLSGIGLELMITSCFACSILFSLRRSLVLIVIGLVAILFIAYIMTTELIVIYEYHLLTSKSWLAWITAIVVFGLGTLLMVIAPQMILVRLEESLQMANQKAEHLKQSNEKLFEEISKRVKVEEEKRLLRQYLRNIIDFMPSVIIGLGEDLSISHWNQQAEKATGCKASEAKGKYLMDIFPQLNSEMDEIRQAIFMNKTYQQNKLPIDFQDGSRFMELLVYPIRTGEKLGAVIRLDDITARIQMEETMIQTDKLASIGCLTAGIAHEINNPLGVILQGVQMVSNRLSSSLEKNRDVAREIGVDLDKMAAYLEERKISRYIDGIKEAGHRSSEIISNMLQFTRKSESVKSTVTVIKLVERALVFVGNDFNLTKNYDFKKITIIRQYDPNLNSIVCNETEIEQVLLNVIKNAAQALQNKGHNAPSMIIIRTKNEDSMGLIEIEDNGPGMSQDVIKRIFEPFYTTKDVGKGTGLGLAVSYMIVTNNHNGALDVESTPGKGTVFSIRLPK